MVAWGPWFRQWVFFSFFSCDGDTCPLEAQVRPKVCFRTYRLSNNNQKVATSDQQQGTPVLYQWPRNKYLESFSRSQSHSSPPTPLFLSSRVSSMSRQALRPQGTPLCFHRHPHCETEHETVSEDKGKHQNYWAPILVYNLVLFSCGISRVAGGFFRTDQIFGIVWGAGKLLSSLPCLRKDLTEYRGALCNSLQQWVITATGRWTAGSLCLRINPSMDESW